MTGCERIVQRLRQGPASHLELYQLGVIAHSRVAELRRRGYEISCDRDGDLYVYRLDTEPSKIGAAARLTAPSEDGSAAAAPMHGRTAPSPATPLPWGVAGQLTLLGDTA